MKNRVLDNVPWEDIVGYCRAIKISDRIEIAGCVAVDEKGHCISESVSEQAEYIIQKAQSALNALDANLEDVIRTRIYVTDIGNWQEVGVVHGKYFKHIKPVTTMVEVSALISPEYHVEIEFSAIISGK